MTGQKTFSPAWGKGVSITAGAAATDSLIDDNSLNGSGSSSVVITNTGTDLAYVRVSRSDDVKDATAADYLIMPQAQVSLTKFRDNDTLSVIAPSGAPVIYAIRGEGF